MTTTALRRVVDINKTTTWHVFHVPLRVSRADGRLSEPLGSASRVCQVPHNPLTSS